MKLTLSRYPSDGDDGTWGTLKTEVAGEVYLPTLEENWIPNPSGPGGMRRAPGQRESCVPVGTYRLEPHDSANHPNTWALVNLELGVFHQKKDAPAIDKWGRVAILIHPGNDTDDTEGCILVGRHRYMQAGRPIITDSRLAMEDLQKLLGAGVHELEIRRA